MTSPIEQLMAAGFSSQDIAIGLVAAAQVGRFGSMVRLSAEHKGCGRPGCLGCGGGGGGAGPAQAQAPPKEVKEVQHKYRKELFAADLLLDKSKLEGLPIFCAICQDLCCDIARVKATSGDVEEAKSWARIIDSARVRCLHGECKWTGCRSDLQGHLTEKCPLEPFVCGRCKETMSRDKAEEHAVTKCPYRRIKCQHCGEAMAARLMASHAKESCEKDPTPCTVGDLRKVVREARDKLVKMYSADADDEEMD